MPPRKQPVGPSWPAHKVSTDTNSVEYKVSQHFREHAWPHCELEMKQYISRDVHDNGFDFSQLVVTPSTSQPSNHVLGKHISWRRIKGKMVLRYEPNSVPAIVRLLFLRCIFGQSKIANNAWYVPIRSAWASFLDRITFDQCPTIQVTPIRRKRPMRTADDATNDQEISEDDQAESLIGEEDDETTPAKKRKINNATTQTDPADEPKDSLKDTNMLNANLFHTAPSAQASTRADGVEPDTTPRTRPPPSRQTQDIPAQLRRDTAPSKTDLSSALIRSRSLNRDDLDYIHNPLTPAEAYGPRERHTQPATINAQLVTTNNQHAIVDAQLATQYNAIMQALESLSKTIQDNHAEVMRNLGTPHRTCEPEFNATEQDDADSPNGRVESPIHVPRDDHEDTQPPLGDDNSTDRGAGPWYHVSPDVDPIIQSFVATGIPDFNYHESPNMMPDERSEPVTVGITQ